MPGARHAAADVAQATDPDREQLAGISLFQHLDSRQPLDPFEAAPAGGDEPSREAMAMRERLAA
jgi:hypothetical protein